MNYFKKIIKKITPFKPVLEVPSSWSEVTLDQFIQLEDLPIIDNEVTNTINKLSIITGKEPEEIRKLKSKDLYKVSKKLKFLSELPKEKNVKWFFHKWKLYKREEVHNTNVFQVTDIIKANEEEKNVGAKILNVLSGTYYTGKNKKYNGDRFRKNHEELLSLDFATAYNSSVFFLTGLKNYLPNVLTLFLQKMKVNQIELLNQKIGKTYSTEELLKYISGMTS